MQIFAILSRESAIDTNLDKFLCYMAKSKDKSRLDGTDICGKTSPTSQWHNIQTFTHQPNEMISYFYVRVSDVMLIAR